MGGRVIAEMQIPERRVSDRRKSTSRRRNLLRWVFNEFRRVTRRKDQRRVADRNEGVVEKAKED